jgi:hypothetical protein
VHLDDVPQIVPQTAWSYNADGKAISLQPAGTSFIPNDIYEFSYTAKAGGEWHWLRCSARLQPPLRYEKGDDTGTANPLAGDVMRIYTEVSSQPDRLPNDFRNLGSIKPKTARSCSTG